MNGDRRSPGVFIPRCPKVEAEAHPALDGVAEHEHDAVHIDEGASKADGDNFGHQDWDSSEDHEGAGAGDESKGEEHAYVN